MAKIAGPELSRSVRAVRMTGRDCATLGSVVANCVPSAAVAWCLVQNLYKVRPRQQTKLMSTLDRTAALNVPTPQRRSPTVDLCEIAARLPGAKFSCSQSPERTSALEVRLLARTGDGSGDVKEVYVLVVPGETSPMCADAVVGVSCGSRRVGLWSDRGSDHTRVLEHT